MRQALQLLEAEAADFADLGFRLSGTETVRLYEACRAVCEPEDCNVRLDLLGIPEAVGGTSVRLWSLSIAAGCWLEEYAAVWWPGSSLHYFYALAFAMANSRSDVFRTLTDPEMARKEIVRFALGLSAHASELEAAVDRVLGNPSGAVRKGGSTEPSKMSSRWLSLIGELEVASGIPADDWLFRKSASVVFAIWSRQMQIRIALAGGKPEARDALAEAIESLARIKKELIDRKRREAAKKEAEAAAKKAKQ